MSAYALFNSWRRSSTSCGRIVRPQGAARRWGNTLRNWTVFQTGEPVLDQLAQVNHMCVCCVCCVWVLCLLRVSVVSVVCVASVVCVLCLLRVSVVSVVCECCVCCVWVLCLLRVSVVCVLCLSHRWLSVCAKRECIKAMQVFDLSFSMSRTHTRILCIANSEVVNKYVHSWTQNNSLIQ